VREWGRSTFNLLKQLLDLVLAPVAVYVHPQHMVLQRAGKAKTQEQLRQLSLTKPHVDMRKGERRGEGERNLDLDQLELLIFGHSARGAHC